MFTPGQQAQPGSTTWCTFPKHGELERVQITSQRPSGKKKDAAKNVHPPPKALVSQCVSRFYALSLAHLSAVRVFREHLERHQVFDERFVVSVGGVDQRAHLHVRPRQQQRRRRRWHQQRRRRWHQQQRRYRHTKASTSRKGRTRVVGFTTRCENHSLARRANKSRSCFLCAHPLSCTCGFSASLQSLKSAKVVSPAQILFPGSWFASSSDLEPA